MAQGLSEVTSGLAPPGASAGHWKLETISHGLSRGHRGEQEKRMQWHMLCGLQLPGPPLATLETQRKCSHAGGNRLGRWLLF